MTSFLSITLDISPGTAIAEACRCALREAQVHDCKVEFDFNGVHMVVNKTDLLELLLASWDELRRGDKKPQFDLSDFPNKFPSLT